MLTIWNIFSSCSHHYNSYEVLNLNSTYLSDFSFYGSLPHHLSFKLEKVKHFENCLLYWKADTKIKELETKQNTAKYYCMFI